MSEHDGQRMLFDWAAFVPELKTMFAIPNGGQRSIVTATRLKKEGVRRGVPDIFAPIARGNYHGLFIEMKIENGRVSTHQLEYLKALNEAGYRAIICLGFDDARAKILEYLAL